MTAVTRKPRRKTAPKKPRTDIAQDVTDRIIASLEAGVVPWKPQHSGGSGGTSGGGGGMPVNDATGTEYRGINVILLWMSAMSARYSSCRWMTYKQAAALGGQVKKGEKGTRIVFYNVVEKDAEGDEPTRRAFTRYYVVFNRDQIADLPPSESENATPEDQTPREPIGEALDLMVDYLACSNAPTVVAGNQPAYRPATDEIMIPDSKAFTSMAAYYSTLQHELIHSTGHPNRLNRPGIADFDAFGTEQYGTEEMIAELGSAMLAARCGIFDDTLEMTAAYIGGWLKQLKKDKRFFLQSAGAAQKAVDYVLHQP